MTQTVDLWILEIPREPWVLEQCLPQLSATEAVRCRRLVNDDLRRRFAASHACMRAVLGCYLRHPTECVDFEIGEAGKPRLRGREGPFFNLSHSGEAMALAVSREVEVGVDIEAIRDVGDVEGLAESFFTETEWAALPAEGDPRRAGQICGIWTIKEACAKAVGQGLLLDLTKIAPCCSLVSSRLSTGAFEAVYDVCARGYHLVHRWAPLPGYVAALALPEQATAEHRPLLQHLQIRLVEGLGFALSAWTRGARRTFIPEGQKVKDRVSGQYWGEMAQKPKFVNRTFSGSVKPRRSMIL